MPLARPARDTSPWKFLWWMRAYPTSFHVVLRPLSSSRRRFLHSRSSSFRSSTAQQSLSPYRSSSFLFLSPRSEPWYPRCPHLCWNIFASRYRTFLALDSRPINSTINTTGREPGAIVSRLERPSSLSPSLPFFSFSLSFRRVSTKSSLVALARFASRFDLYTANGPTLFPSILIFLDSRIVSSFPSPSPLSASEFEESCTSTRVETTPVAVGPSSIIVTRATQIGRAHV